MQPRSGEHAAKTTADNDDFDLILDSITLQFAVDIRVFDKVSKLTAHFLILVITIRAEAFISLFLIFASQGFWIKGHRLGISIHYDLPL